MSRTYRKDPATNGGSRSERSRRKAARAIKASELDRLVAALMRAYQTARESAAVAGRVAA